MEVTDAAEARPLWFLDQHFIYVSDFQASARDFDKKNFYVFAADVLN